MSPIEVPYRDKPDQFGGTVCNPVLEVEVLTVDLGYQPFFFLLDSGADCTIVPKDMAKLLGVILPRSAETWLEGIGAGRMAAHRHTLSLRIQGEDFQVACLITKSNSVPFLLGRVDFFDAFNIAFDNQNQKMVLDRLP